MKNYHQLIERILTEGILKSNRTGIDTLMVPSAELKFDLAEGFPAITTKKLAFQSMKGELLGFFRGFNSAAQFRELQCKIWDANANETQSWLDNPNRKQHGQNYLGDIYGRQWTGWRDTRFAYGELNAQALLEKGYEQIAFDPVKNLYVMERRINQVEEVLKKLLTNPSDRRMIVSGWRPDEFDNMALPPCHVLYNFMAIEATKELHVAMYQRSADVGLGVPFNVASTSLFLALMARLSGYTARTVTVYMADAHIYVNHIEALKQQITRESFAAPRLVLADSIEPVRSVQEVAGVFARIEPKDIWLEGYQHHPTIAMDMAA